MIRNYGSMLAYALAWALLAVGVCSAQTWRTIPAPLGLTTVIRSDPHRPGMVYIAYRGVIAATSDGGQQWSYKSYSHYADYAPKDLLIDSRDSTRWYMAMGEVGYMRSTDGGLNWECRNDNLLLSEWIEYKQIVQDSTRPEIMYLLSTGAVYRSTDRGESWRVMLDAYTSRVGESEASFLVINRNYADSVYIFGIGGPTRWVSGDAGLTWRPDSSRLNYNRAFIHTQLGELLAGPWLSRDYGKSWIHYNDFKGMVLVRPWGEPNSGDLSLYDEVNDRYILTHTSGVWTRSRGTPQWIKTNIADTSDGKIYGFACIMRDPFDRSLWCQYDNQVWRLAPDGTQLALINSGPYMATTSFFSTHDMRGGIILGSSLSTMDNGKTWSYLNSNIGAYERGADMYGAVSPVDSLFMVRGVQMLYYTTRGYEGPWALSNAMFFALPIGKIHFNPHNPREIFGGTLSGLWRVTDSVVVHQVEMGTTTSSVITPLYGEQRYMYSAMAFHPWHDGVYYLCSWEQKPNHRKSTLSVSQDYGKTWSPLLDQLSYLYRDVCVNPVDPDVIIIASWDGILRSTDAGKTWTQNYDPPIQSPFMESVLIDPRYPHVYYAGALSVPGYMASLLTGKRSGGVYVSYDYGASWEALPLDGMHNVSVRALHYHENPRRLLAASMAGVYEMLLPEYVTTPEPLPVSGALELRAYPNPVAPGQSQTLTLRGAEGRHTIVDMYSIHGKHIARVYDGVYTAGSVLRAPTAALPSGVYYYRVLAGAESRTVRMMVRK